MMKWNYALAAVLCLGAAGSFTACTNGDRDQGAESVGQQEGTVENGEAESEFERRGEADCTGLTEEQCNELKQKMQEGEDAIQQGGDAAKEGAKDTQQKAEDLRD